ncbi:MAG: hypothetical protein ABIB12_00600, partial [Patescibacteria group bacterium]
MKRKFFGIGFVVMLVLLSGLAVQAAGGPGSTPTMESQDKNYTEWEILGDAQETEIGKPLVPSNEVLTLFFEEGDMIFPGDTIARMTLYVQN